VAAAAAVYLGDLSAMTLSEPSVTREVTIPTSRKSRSDALTTNKSEWARTKRPDSARTRQDGHQASFEPHPGRKALLALSIMIPSRSWRLVKSLVIGWYVTVRRSSVGPPRRFFPPVQPGRAGLWPCVPSALCLCDPGWVRNTTSK
jgi:hypothetical protein